MASGRSSAQIFFGKNMSYHAKFGPVKMDLGEYVQPSDHFAISMGLNAEALMRVAREEIPNHQSQTHYLCLIILKETSSWLGFAD